MRGNQDYPDDDYAPEAIMARVGHLSARAQRDVEQIARIIRSTFGHGGSALPEDGRIVRIVLTGPASASTEADGYSFAIVVNRPDCADEGQWDFTREVIAAEIGAERSVMLSATAAGSASVQPAGPIIYDAATDVPLNARELLRNPAAKDLH